MLKFNYKDCGEVCQLFRVGKWGRPRLAGMVPGLAFARAKTQRYYDARAPRMRLLPSSAGVFDGPGAIPVRRGLCISIGEDVHFLGEDVHFLGEDVVFLGGAQLGPIDGTD